MKKHKLFRLEAALIAGVIAVLFSGIWLQEEQSKLADQMIRLHVIANSDREEDQKLKLAVRDRILEVSREIYPSDYVNRKQAESLLRQRLDELEQAGAQVVKQAGYSYPVHAELTQCWFPTKEYDDFALPAGKYTALRVVIGEGEGKNWWCVAFPPLCVGAASQTVEWAEQAGYFTSEQAQLMTKEGEGYILKFYGMELLGKIQGELTQ